MITIRYLEIDNRKPDVLENIYIPQHPAGRDKAIALMDSNAYGDTGRE